MPSKASSAAAKALGIKLQDSDPYKEPDRPGASVSSEQSAHTFVESPPLVLDYLAGLLPSGTELYDYVVSLFPFLSWIGHYNLQWLIGDLVAGKELSFRGYKNSGWLTARQASLSALSLFPKAWLTPSWLISKSSLACIRPSWVLYCTGSLQRRKTSPSA